MSRDRMRAVRVHEHGGPDALAVETVERPEPDADEIVVETRAVGYNPMDALVREGHLDVSLPAIPGGDISGVVHAVGEDVTDFEPGDPVYGTTALESVGAYAEYVTSRPGTLAAKPESLDHVHAAAVPTVALTAWQGLFEVGSLDAGETALVHGAAGGVGSFAVQFADAAGARVVATAADDDLDYVRDLGADEAIDYETAFEEQVEEVDFVLDVVGGETLERSWEVLAPDGLLVSTAEPIPEEVTERHDREGAFFAVDADAERLREFGEQFDAGDLTVTVGETLALAEAPEAHELAASDDAPRGKIVLRTEDGQ